ncbi:MAG: GNAT family N-acetyltransferase [[Clostridium] leptum]
MYQIQFSRGLDALPLAKELRRKVFITEQGFQNEFDDIDRTAWHVLISEGGFPCGTGRVFETPAGSGCYHLGRIAVERDYRKQHIGSLAGKLEEKARAGRQELQLFRAQEMQAQDLREKTVHAVGPLVHPLIPMRHALRIDGECQLLDRLHKHTAKLDNSGWLLVLPFCPILLCFLFLSHPDFSLVNTVRFRLKSCGIWQFEH